MRLLFFLLFAFGVFMSIPVTAQKSQIKGHIIDAKTGELISYASVKIDNVNALTADSTGFFRIDLEPGKYKFTLSKIGYTTLFQTVRLGVEESLNVTFGMESFVNELNRVVISGSKQEKQLVREPISIVSIQPYLIANTNSNTLSDVLNKVPGISVIEGQALIRGSAGWSYNVGSRVMVTLDEMPLMGADVGDVQWDLLPIEAAENIEVLKGPSSVLYGSSASSGTIAVRTGWTTKKPQTKIQFYQGITENPKAREGIWWERTSQPFNNGAFFSHKQQLGKFDLICSGNIDANRSYLQQNDQYRARIYTKTRYRFESIKGLSAGLSSTLLFKKGGRFFLWENADTGIFKPWQGSSGQDFYRIWSLTPFVSFTKPNNYTLTLKLQHYNITRFVDTLAFPGQNDAIANIQAMDINFQKRWSSRINTTTGIYATRLWAVGNVYPGEHKGFSMAAFTQLETNITSKLNFVTGIRYELNAIGVIEETARPLLRAGINYQAGKSTFIRATYGEGYRFPTIAERFVQDRVKIISILPNPYLKSERGWYVELGVKKGFKVDQFNFTTDFSFFWQEYRNLIEFRFKEWEPVKIINIYDSSGTLIDRTFTQSIVGFKAINIDYVRTAGHEISIEGDGKIGQVGIRTLCGYTYIFPVDLNSDTNYRSFGTYMNNYFSAMTGITDEQKKNVLPYRNRHLVKTDIEFNYRKLMFGYANFYYHVYDKIDAPLYEFLPGIQQFFAAVGNGDWVHNVRFGYQLTSHITIALLVNNFTNHAYAIRPARMDQPRNYNLQLRINL